MNSFALLVMEMTISLISSRLFKFPKLTKEGKKSTNKTPPKMNQGIRHLYKYLKITNNSTGPFFRTVFPLSKKDSAKILRDLI